MAYAEADPHDGPRKGKAQSPTDMAFPLTGNAEARFINGQGSLPRLLRRQALWGERGRAGVAFWDKHSRLHVKADLQRAQKVADYHHEIQDLRYLRG